MLFDDVWGTTEERASPRVRNPSSAFEVFPEWNGATISHDSLRASAFVVFFHIRDDVAHRFFAAVPPMPILLVGPSTITSQIYPSDAAIGITMAAVSYNRFENRRFVIQMGPAPWIRLNDPFYFNVTVVAHPSLVDASVQDAIATTAAVFAVIFFSPMGSMMQSRAIIMTSIVVCQEESENNLFSILNVGVGDTRDAGYYQRGAIAGNFGIVAMVVGVLLGVAVLTTLVARPKRRETTWQRCCDILHFPSNIIVPAQLMLLPTMASSVSLMAQWGTYGDISVGATGVTAVVLYLSFLTYSCSSFAAVAVETRTYPVKSLPLTHLDPIYTLWAGRHHWVGKSQRWMSWKRQYYYMFALHDNRGFFLMETWSQTIVACLAGVVVGDVTYCAGHHVVIGVLSLTFLCLHVVFQPLLSLPHHVVIVFSYGMWLCSAVCACVGMLLGYGPVSTTLLDASTITNLLTMCLVIVLSLPRGVYMLLIARKVVINLWTSTEYRFPKDARKAKPHDIELLPHAQPDALIALPEELPKPFVPPPAPMALPPPPKRILTINEVRALHRRDLAAFATLTTDDRSGSNKRNSNSSSSSNASSRTSSSSSVSRSSKASSSRSSVSSDSLSGAEKRHEFVEVVAAPAKGKVLVHSVRHPSTQPNSASSLPQRHLPMAKFRSFAGDGSSSDDDPFAAFDDAVPASASYPSPFDGSISMPRHFDASATQSVGQPSALMGGSLSFGNAMHSVVSVDIPLQEVDDDLL
jgi:uncharacterized membrane protein YgcG